MYSQTVRIFTQNNTDSDSKCLACTLASFI